MRRAAPLHFVWLTAILMVFPSCLWPASAAQLAGVELPRRVDLGGQVLELASCGVRDTLWIEHFTAALYVAPQLDPAEALLDPAAAKVVRLDIVNAAWLPERQPEEWRDPLHANLAPARYRQVRDLYRRLRPGDVIIAAYEPGRGISVARNGRAVVREPGQELIDDLLRAWAGSQSPSDKLRQLLAKHPC